MPTLPPQVEEAYRKLKETGESIRPPAIDFPDISTGDIPLIRDIPGIEKLLPQGSSSYLPFALGAAAIPAAYYLYKKRQEGQAKSQRKVAAFTWLDGI